MPLTLREQAGVALSAAQYDEGLGEKVSQAAHGFAVGNLVYLGGAGWAKAQADAAGKLADGIVVWVPDVDTFFVVTQPGSVVTITAHGLGSAATELYLSQGSAGAATSTKPTSGLIQYVAKVVDANTLMWQAGKLPLVEI